MLSYQETKSSSKEAILFIHGIGASSWMWWQQIPAFSDYPVITVDLPGHGKSAAVPWTSLADTAHLIAEHVLKNRTAHVVGISLGGHVALELAKRYPEKILSVLISGITVKPMPFQFLLPLQSRSVQNNLHNEPYLRKLAREYYQLPADKTAEFISNYQLLTRKTYETIWKEVMAFRLDESYGTITSPCLFTAGELESRGILESITIAPNRIATAEGKVIPQAQHAWPVQRPEQFNRVLRTWLTNQV